MAGSGLLAAYPGLQADQQAGQRPIFLRGQLPGRNLLQVGAADVETLQLLFQLLPFPVIKLLNKKRLHMVPVQIQMLPDKNYFFRIRQLVSTKNQLSNTGIWLSMNIGTNRLVLKRLNIYAKRFYYTVRIHQWLQLTHNVMQVSFALFATIQ